MIAEVRGVFRTLSNMYGVAFLRKWLTAKQFPQKSSIIDIQLHSKYASGDKVYQSGSSRKLGNSSLCYEKIPSKNISLSQFLRECFNM